MKRFVSVVLAAGLGTRMRSEIAKVMHPILGRSMLTYPLAALRQLKPSKISVVTGYQGDLVEAAFNGPPDLVFGRQKALNGTADAFKTGLAALRKLDALEPFSSAILVLNGDMPLVRKETLQSLFAAHGKGTSKNSLTVGTFITDIPGSYGRILRNKQDRITGIVENKDASAPQRLIREVNGGIYLIEPEVLSLIDKIRPKNAAGEYYLTDIVALAAKAGFKVGGCMVGQEDLMGVNSRRELAEAADVLRLRIISGLMDAGVSVMHPESTFIHPDVKIGRDTIIYPNVTIEGSCRIGDGCTLYPGVRLVNAVIGKGVVIKDSSLIEESRIGDGCFVGPFAHLRPGSLLKKNVKVGNFVELKKTVLENGSKAMHLSYLGDASIGKNVNIGAGTITCNYDGINKNQTTICEGAFIGSDTQLIAPVRIGKGAYVGAGSTVTSNVPPGDLAVSRSKQRNIKGWAKKRK